MTRTLSLALFLIAAAAPASDLVDATPVNDRIVLLHFNDGRVIHHKAGQRRSDETVVTDPLDVKKAQSVGAYRVTSPDDPAYKTAKSPTDVGRKSKGTDFAWFVDRWENGHAVNDRPDHTKEHWLYLYLPSPLKAGKTYNVALGALAKNAKTAKIVFDPAKARSESVHVNLLGYVPTAPRKTAYVYHWAGDRGGVDYSAYAGRAFRVVDQATGKAALTGKVAFRAPASLQETGQKTETPDGNFLGAPVWECDFSALTKPGRYVVAVDGVGCSFPFAIGADVYRTAFETTVRGLYHNRSGIALTKPYTEFERPAPHHPKLTPGFADKLKYVTIPVADWGTETGDKAKLTAAMKGTLTDAWGWYQDAGDWDGYPSHLRVPSDILLTYLMAPAKFRDGEANLPESGNGVPDILDEAAWLPRFGHRLRTELLKKGWGTGGVSMKVSGDAFGGDETPDGKGRGSWQDNDRFWCVAAEDAESTYRYAGVCALLAQALKTAGKPDPQGVDWAKEARETYAWAAAHTRPQDEAVVRPHRTFAAAALFWLTGEKPYEARFGADTADLTPATLLNDDRYYGPFAYLLANRARDAATDARTRAAVRYTVDFNAIETPAKRALRWGGDFNMPMLIGQQTTPWMMPVMVGYTLAKTEDPARAKTLLSTLYSTADYFLGANSLNQTWVTGLGPRYPTQAFHMDAWYNGKGRFHPGIVPYGPWRKQSDDPKGPWDSDWANPTAYPAIDLWPGGERWFSNRCSPLTSEFTIHQNTAPSAALFGFLCGPAK